MKGATRITFSDVAGSQVASTFRQIIFISFSCTVSTLVALDGVGACFLQQKLANCFCLSIIKKI